MSDRSEIANKSALPETVNGPDLAALFNVTDRQVRNWAAEGLVKKAGRGRYLLSASVQAVIGRANAQAASEADKARIAFMDAKRQALEIETAHRRHELVPLSEVDERVVGIFGALKSEILALPARVTRDMALRRQLDAECVNALNRAAKKLAAHGAALRGGAPLEIDGDEDE